MIACDVSEYQPVVDNSYPHKWLIFRAFDGTYLDSNFQHNLAWAKAAKVAGRLYGYIVYFVWEPGDDPIARLNALGVPTDCVLMIDVESWGRIFGNHSGELSRIAQRCVDRQGGDPSLVWGYFNRGDGNALWPNRPILLGGAAKRAAKIGIQIVLASYGGTVPTGVPNMVGWQYTNGQYVVAGKPSSSAPFGACDHNELFIGAESGLGGGTPLTNPTPSPSTDWFDTVDQATLQTMLDKLGNRIITGDLQHPNNIQVLNDKLDTISELLGLAIRGDFGPDGKTPTPKERDTHPYNLKNVFKDNEEGLKALARVEAALLALKTELAAVPVSGGVTPEQITAISQAASSAVATAVTGHAINLTGSIA